MMQFDYDVVVIGAGTGGLVSAFVADGMGARVLLVEREKMGGECLWSGCVPSKTLIQSARVFDLVGRSEEFGVHIEQPRLVWNAVKLRIKDVQDDIKKLERAQMAQSQVEFVRGEARFIDEHLIEIRNSLELRRVRARKIILATGSKATIPNISGLENVPFLTHETVFDLPSLPRSLAIIGGGPVGCELAQAFARLGSKVTLLQRDTRLLPHEDADVSEIAAKILRNSGVQVLAEAQVLSARADEDNKYLQVRCDGQESEIRAGQLLIAAGKTVQSDALQLKNAGVKANKNGIEVNDFGQTSVAHIFACGDATGGFRFTHAAEHSAKIVVQNALLPISQRTQTVMPWTTFLDPEIARVGLTEEEARAKNGRVRVWRQEFKTLDRAIIEGETQGFCKIVTSGSGRILGAHIVGAHAGELISPWVIGMRNGMLLEEWAETVHVYPTLSEISHRAGNIWFQDLLKNRLIKTVLRRLTRRT